MSDTAPKSASLPTTLLARWKRPSLAISWEVFVLVAITAFCLCYGLVPYFGGAAVGLVGADEPRYAQVAREMLAAHQMECHETGAHLLPSSLRLSAIEASFNCLRAGTVTPMLYGQPWLEKPALYYWRAMGFFDEFGVSDWSSRLPGASGAFFLIALIYLHMRRFRPGGHLDAALITASCVGIVAFARGASTDMQLAAPFCIGMLGWYAWYETGKKFWLFDLYFFVGAATLAKGPIAPFMALIIIFLFVGLRREWSLLRRSIWWPGIALYLAMVLPWYIAVQRRNPTFFEQFFLQHNLERFATNRYQHHQPVWFYAAVLVLALMPWTVLSIRALVDSLQTAITEWKVRRNPSRYLGLPRAGDAFPEFLVLWALFPIIFFSFSGSKLPGYILPALPPTAILTGDYLFRARKEGLRPWLLVMHAITAGIFTFVLLLSPQYMVYQRIIPPAHALISALAVSLAIVVLILLVVTRYGLQRLRAVTLVPVVLMLFFLLKLNGPLLDDNYSSRPLERAIQKAAPGVGAFATYQVRRDIVYGLAFYRDQRPLYYEDGVPAQAHVLIVRESAEEQLRKLLVGRTYQPLFLFPWQGLAVYKVDAKQ
ncbi:MAG: ArnT family glycosyltransferase [Acidobacteriaceae bacterium]